jgi:hypothetical protein
MHESYQGQIDKRNTNESKTDFFVHKISRYFVCISSFIWLSLKLKSDEKLISSIIFVENSLWKSKCSIYSKLLPHVLVLGTHF